MKKGIKSQITAIFWKYHGCNIGRPHENLSRALADAGELAAKREKVLMRKIATLKKVNKK